MNATMMTRSTPPAPPKSRRRWRWLALAVAVPVLLGGLALWYFVLRHDTPAAVNLDAAIAGIESTPATSVPATSASTAPAPAAAVSASPADGTWTIDRTIANAQGSGSFAGFRIDEVLVRVGSATAVGRTPTVEGSVTVSGSTVSAAEITADLTDVTTNDSRRDDAVQRALSTTRFPNATFELTQPIQLPSTPAEGERITVPATGDLTIRGVTRATTIDLQAQLQGGVLVVVGSAPVRLADFGVTAPTSPLVASVEDEGTFEFQLYFRRS